MKMRIVYASPDVMGKRESEETPQDKEMYPRGKGMYPLSHLEDDVTACGQQTKNTGCNAPDDAEDINRKLEEAREKRLLTDTIYDVPDLLGDALKEDEKVMECVYASPRMMGWTESAPKKKQGLLSRILGGKRK